MKNVKLATALMITLFLGAVQSVNAQEVTQEQELSQDCEVVCEVGAYGQESSCRNTCSQTGKQVQTVTLSDGTVLAAHAPVNTGLELNPTLMASLMAVLATGTLLIRKKLV